MEYAKLPGLTPDGTMYWNEEMGTVEAVLPPGGYKTAHGPGLLELENGDMLCVWFAGSFEGNADVNVICARLKKGAVELIVRLYGGGDSSHLGADIKGKV